MKLLLLQIATQIPKVVPEKHCCSHRVAVDHPFHQNSYDIIHSYIIIICNYEYCTGIRGDYNAQV